MARVNKLLKTKKNSEIKVFILPHVTLNGLDGWVKNIMSKLDVICGNMNMKSFPNINGFDM